MAKAKEEEKVLQGNDPSQSVGEDNAHTLSVGEADSSLKGRASEEAENKNESKPTMAELIAEEKARMEEYVTITLFKDGDKYKDDVYVSVNGQNCAVQRGVPVRIKRKFALEIAKSQFEDQRTAARIALLTKE